MESSAIGAAESPFAIQFVPAPSDGSEGFAILPFAALLTGALFTIGIAVLLIVVLAIRRKRDGHGAGLCDGKEKHIGMDITVTTPLEMGMGQQKYVVAYTLKQGVEKQPDILSAQKTQGSASVPSIKDMGGRAGSPVGMMRPPELATGTIYAAGYDHQQKSTPSSRQSTLKRTADNTANNYSLLQQQQQQQHLSGSSKYSTELLEYEKPYTTPASTTTTTAATSAMTATGQHTLQYNHNPPPLVDPYAYKSSPSDTMGYRLPGLTGDPYHHGQHHSSQHHSSSTGGGSSSLKTAALGTGTTAGGQVVSRANTTSAGANPEYRYSGSEFVTDLLDFSTAPSPSSSHSHPGGMPGTATLTKNRNRQHIITDTLPGPESCV
uniref:Uncharacterized protein n=1 Tax=Anopheles albimanus TaxID=7167 RepID=A0A182FAU9_ANOAL